MDFYLKIIAQNPNHDTSDYNISSESSTGGVVFLRGGCINVKGAMHFLR